MLSTFVREFQWRSWRWSPCRTYLPAAARYDKEDLQKEKYECIKNLSSGRIEQTTGDQEVPQVQYKLQYLGGDTCKYKMLPQFPCLK